MAYEVFGVAERIPEPMLREEVSIRMLGPPRTRRLDICRPEMHRDAALASRSAEITHEPARVPVSHDAPPEVITVDNQYVSCP
jgi:hypothetical protein